MLLDLLEVDGVAEPGGLEQIAGVAPECGEVCEALTIALEVRVVDRVEPDERREQSYVRLCDPVSHEIAAGREALLDRVECGEEAVERLLVRSLSACEAAPVHAVVDLRVDQAHDGVHLVAQRLRVQDRGACAVEARPLRGEVEGDLREVVRDDGSGGDVHHGGHGDAAGIVGEACEERLLEAFDPQHGVDSAGIQVERPRACVVRGTRHAE